MYILIKILIRIGGIVTSKEVNNKSYSTWKDKLKQLKQSKPDPMPKLRDDAECVVSTHNLLDKLFNLIITCKQDYGLGWLMGLYRYVKDKENSLKNFNNHLDRGHIVEVDLFGHFNKELSFTHPAVVLYDDNKDGWLLIAPISTPKNGSIKEFYIDVDERDDLIHPSAICLDDLRAIDKRRVLYQHTKNNVNCKIRDVKLDKIDEVILECFLPQTHKIFNNLKKELLKEREMHENTKEELCMLKETLTTRNVTCNM